MKHQGNECRVKHQEKSKERKGKDMDVGVKDREVRCVPEERVRHQGNECEVGHQEKSRKMKGKDMEVRVKDREVKVWDSKCPGV